MECGVRPRAALLLASVLLASAVAPPKQKPVVWKNLFAKTATISRTTAEVDSGDMLGDALEDDKPATALEPPSPQELPSAGDGEEFAPGMAKVRDAFLKANSQPKDAQLKSLKDWDFMPTIGKDASNSFYFGR